MQFYENTQPNMQNVKQNEKMKSVLALLEMSAAAAAALRLFPAVRST